MALSAVAISCSSPQSDIEFRKGSSINPFLEYVSSVSLVPLETDSLHILGNNPELMISGTDFILTDAQNGSIYRYSNTGQFLNKIGGKGNGPEEYLMIVNTQLANDEIIVFSKPDKILKYNPDGSFVTSMSSKNLGLQSYCIDNGILSYNGYGSGLPDRLIYAKDGNTTGFLKSDEKVFGLAGGSPVFTDLPNGDVAVIDSYSPTIQRYSKGKVNPYCSVDFGGISIPESFFKYDDAMKAMDFLLSREFAIIKRYFEGPSYKFLSIFTQKRDKANEYYGISHQGKWKWFWAGELGTDIFAGSFRAIDSTNTIYCIIDPILLDNFPNEVKRLLDKPEILESLNKEGNYVIAEFHLK